MGTNIGDIICKKAPKNRREGRIQKGLRDSREKRTHYLKKSNLALDDKAQLTSLNDVQARQIHQELFDRREVLDYVREGLEQLVVAEKAHLEGSTCSILHGHAKTTEKRSGEQPKVVRTDPKLFLYYNFLIKRDLIPAPGFAAEDSESQAERRKIKASCVDFLLTHAKTTYFGIILPDLLKFNRERFQIIDAVGQDVFSKSYGGFVIFAPMDDHTINFDVELDYHDLALQELFALTYKKEFSDKHKNVDYRSLDALLKHARDRHTIQLKKAPRDRVTRRILSAFPHTGHILGLPYDRSQLPDYFLNPKKLFHQD